MRSALIPRSAHQLAELVGIRLAPTPLREPGVLLESAPPTAREPLKEVLDLHAAGREEAAQEHARRALDEKGEQPILRVYLAEAAGRARLSRDAERHLQHALDEDPGCRLAHAAYGRLLESQGDWQDAKQAYLWAVRISEGFEEWLGVARVAYELGATDPPLGATDVVLSALVRALKCSKSAEDLVRVGLTAIATERLSVGRIALGALDRIESSAISAYLLAAALILDRDPAANLALQRARLRGSLGLDEHARWNETLAALERGVAETRDEGLAT